MNVITIPCENTTCVKLFITTVIQSLNVMTKWQLRGQTHHNKCSKCLPLALTHALRRSHHWLIDWSITLCWIPDHASNVSSGILAECCMMRPTYSFPGDLTGSLCVPGAPSWLSTKSLTASMFSCSSMWCARFATTQLSFCFAGSLQFLRR